MESNGYYRMKVSFKAFAIPILTAMVSNIIKENAVRIRITNTGYGVT